MLGCSDTANSCTGNASAHPPTQGACYLAPLTRRLPWASSEWLGSPPSPPQLSVHGRSRGCWALQHSQELVRGMEIMRKTISMHSLSCCSQHFVCCCLRHGHGMKELSDYCMAS